MHSSSNFRALAKLCLNGHDYAKRELVRERIVIEALDNGILSCADPACLQKICDSLSVAEINLLLGRRPRGRLAGSSG